MEKQRKEGIFYLQYNTPTSDAFITRFDLESVGVSVEEKEVNPLSACAGKAFDNRLQNRFAPGVYLLRLTEPNGKQWIGKALVE